MKHYVKKKNHDYNSIFKKDVIIDVNKKTILYITL
jgi:hypothetical protein